MSVDSQQPRDPTGRFGEKPDVGIARRMTDRLRTLLGHDGFDTGPAPDDLDVDAVLAAQAAVLDRLPASDAPSPAPDATGDDDARLDAQLAALDGIDVPDSPAGLTEAPAPAGKGLDEWLAEQEATLTALEAKPVIERKNQPDTGEGLFDGLLDEDEVEEKVRKWDPDKHPRDHRGRFASIGSTVSLPTSIGGGEGRVLKATGGGNILVRKADGSEVEVRASDTEVTRSAAANAAHESFNTRAGAGSDGFAAAGSGAAAAPTRAAGAAPSRRRKPSDGDSHERLARSLDDDMLAAADTDKASPEWRAAVQAELARRAAGGEQDTSAQEAVEATAPTRQAPRRHPRPPDMPMGGVEDEPPDMPMGGVEDEPPEDMPMGGVEDEPPEEPELPAPSPMPTASGRSLFEDDTTMDRSMWTGGVAPNGADGSGTRPDGQPWGSGYPEGDPRSDPAYDQYTTELDAKLAATLDEIGDTETIHDKVDGVPGAYRPDRQAQHDALLDELMAEFAGVPKENKAIVMAGPPGAGKTTVLKTDGATFGVEMDGGKPANYAVVNPDDMKELIVAKGLIPDDYPGRGIGPGESATFLHEESSHLAARLLTRLRAEGYNVILDGTFAGNPDKQAGKVRALREGGYTVTGVLVDGTVDRSLSNAARRHRKPPAEPGGGYTGRYVPYGLIETNRPTPNAESAVFGRAHRNKASENIERVQQEFDGGVLWYDNATGQSRLVHRVGPGQQVTVGTDVSAKSAWVPFDEWKMSQAQRRAKPTMPGTEDSFPIGNVEDLDNAIQAYGRAKDKDKAKRWIIRRARDLDAVSHLPESWGVEKSLEGKAGGADRNRGNAERLRRYWTHGAGAAKIRWGTEGDFMRCVTLVSEHMAPERAKGYCNLRHQEAVGAPPGQGAHKAIMESLGLGPMLPPVEVKAEPPATDPAANEAGVANANPEPTGVMVALYPPDDIASALALDGGESVSELHCTLAYLGKVEDVGLERVGELVQLVADFAADSYDQTAEIAGVGRWEAGDDGDAFVALVDAPELPDLRADLVDALTAAGFEVRADHGFTPHITLAYLDQDAQSPLERLEALPATFGFLSVAVGAEVWDFPLNADDADDADDAEGEDAAS